MEKFGVFMSICPAVALQPGLNASGNLVWAMFVIPKAESGLYKSLRRVLHDAVMSKRLLGYVRSLQRVCGVSANGSPSNPLLHAIFALASTLGDEAFYTIALPLCAWMLDLALSRRLALFWASTYYVGQAAKDLLMLPRPPKPVICLEQRYSTEYGLPSTHTMGSLIPLFLATCHWGWNSVGSDGGMPTTVFFSCLAWSGAIAVSRLYMGVHSIPDVAAGYLLGGTLLAFWLTFGAAVDPFLMGNPSAWVAVLAGGGVAILGYPYPERWTDSYGDTALIVATAAGFLEACCLAQGGRGDGTPLQVLRGVHLLSSGRSYDYGWRSAAGDARRCGIGFALLLPMRFALKFVSRRLFSSILALSPNWPQSQTSRRHIVDIPAKVVVYGSMGFSACYVVPLLWLRLGLDVDDR